MPWLVHLAYFYGTPSTGLLRLLGKSMSKTRDLPGRIAHAPLVIEAYSGKTM